MAATLLTKEVCYGAGEYVANKQMRAAGRSAWSRADYVAACIESARLALRLGGMDEVAARDVLSRSREGKRIVREFDKRSAA